MLVKIVGKKKIKREGKKDINVVYFCHVPKEGSDVEGLIAESGFTNDVTFNSLVVDMKNIVDMAVFYEKGYCNIYNKKSE